jgi:hypothetical protein
MAKKRVEQKADEQPILNEGEMMIDDSFQDIPMVEVPKEPVAEVKETPAERYTSKKPSHVVNCLRNEKVTVRFVPSQSAMVH